MVETMEEVEIASSKTQVKLWHLDSSSGILVLAGAVGIKTEIDSSIIYSLKIVNFLTK